MNARRSRSCSTTSFRMKRKGIDFTDHYIIVNTTTYTSIGWQAYRGDQIHRKNSPT